MNKKLIRFIALIILISPWIYIGNVYKEIMYISLALIILLATVDINKKKKDEAVL